MTAKISIGVKPRMFWKPLLATLASCGLLASPGMAAEQGRKQATLTRAVAKVPARVVTAPRYAAMLMDARTGEVLYANAADEKRHPASITKVMTLYLAFDAIDSGQLKLTDPVKISAHAASQKPSRLGLAPGKSISVDDAIRIIAVKSANDIAVALAEKIAGSEPAFVAAMTRKARALGMRNTFYANASGLPNPANVTTARDIALLSAALMRAHPKQYSYFSLRDLSYGKQKYANHNRLLGKVLGVDGIKTGYTLDAGYTLAASAVRDGRRLIAVVLGEPSIAVRNRDATALLETGFTVLKGRALGQRTTVAENLRSVSHPAFRGGPAIEQGSEGENSPARAPSLPKAAAGPGR